MKTVQTKVRFILEIKPRDIECLSKTLNANIINVIELPQSIIWFQKGSKSIQKRPKRFKWVQKSQKYVRDSKWIQKDQKRKKVYNYIEESMRAWKGTKESKNLKVSRKVLKG